MSSDLGPAGALEVVPAGGVRAALARPSTTSEATAVVQRSTGLLVPPYLAEPVKPTTPPRARGERAQALWDSQCEMHERAGLVLLEQACRVVDRLDALDALLAGEVDAWTYVQFDYDQSHDGRVVYELHIDAAAGESRLLMNTLRQLLTTLKAMPTRAAEPTPADQPAATDGEDELTAMRNRRESSGWNTRGAGLDVQA